MTTPIEDYAVIGDTETVALVSRGGSLDWLCLPKFDSPSCFSALLGGPEHGRWLLGPVGPSRTTRRYREDTFVLETVHETDTGAVRVTDLMPLGDDRSDVLRQVEGLEGHVEMEHEWVVRFDYGRIRPWVYRSSGAAGEQGVIVATAGPDRLVLRGSRLPEPADGRHRDTFTVAAGERHDFSLTRVDSWAGLPPALEVDSRVRETALWSADWVGRCTYDGPYRDEVVRSLLVLRLLTDSRRGGIVAAPTTSLPEEVGGSRNWDYRFVWLRDAALTLGSLLRSGHLETTRLWRDWLVRAVAGDPEDLQIMYRVDGSRRLPERTLDHLPGYAGSRPVRVGNDAVGQTQTDVLGEVMIALHDARDLGLEEDPQAWEVQKALVEDLAASWDRPDNGLWEIRGPARHFTHSRVMVWAAFDRAVRAVEEHGLDGRVDRWREEREKVRAAVLRTGYDAARNTFTQHDETTEVDASLLLVPLVGFLPGDDPRVLGTIAAVEEDLLRDGLLLRYRTTSGVDGLPGDEHPFLACSFWLVAALAASGQAERARALMDRLTGLVNDVGLLSEEYDPGRGTMVGNFPQAFSHLTLIQAAYRIADAEGGRGWEGTRRRGAGGAPRR